jgi:hypothetical protein
MTPTPIKSQDVDGHLLRKHRYRGTLTTGTHSDGAKLRNAVEAGSGEWAAEWTSGRTGGSGGMAPPADRSRRSSGTDTYKECTQQAREKRNCKMITITDKHALETEKWALQPNLYISSSKTPSASQQPQTHHNTTTITYCLSVN